MMTDREEIRWKFQVMIDNTKFVIDGIDDQWKNFDEQAERAIQKVERKRNYRLTGIGFTITVILTLVAIGKLEDYEQIGMGIAGILGLWAVILFGLTEHALGKDELMHKEINDVFFDTKTLQFFPIMGKIATFAMEKTIIEEQMGSVQSYLSYNLKGRDYLFRWEIYQILIKDMSKDERKEIDLSRFSHKPYEQTYLDAKREFDLLKKSTLNFEMGGIEEFIKSYERNTKTKSNVR